MEIRCEKCEARFNIPDEKIPKGQRVVIPCPRCKNRMTLDTRAHEQENTAPKAEERTDPVEVRENAGYDYGEDSTLDFFEEGVKLALLMLDDPDEKEKVEQAVEGLGYKYVSPKNTREAIGKMRFHHFDLMILTDGFDGIELKQSPILHYLNPLSMTVRRKIFLALISDDFKTTDNMMAFAMSANLVIDRKDLDKISAVLKKAIAENERFYKVFVDMLGEVGKA